MSVETDRLISAKPSSQQEQQIERSLRPATLAEYVGQEKVRGQLEIFVAGGARARRGARPRAAVRPAGPGQDHPRAHHRPRDGRQHEADLRPGARAPGRSRRDSHEPGAEGRPVHRRDPSPLADRRGDPVPGARGLPDRHHDRRGPGGALDQARPAAVHAGGRDHARRHADQPAARPLRHRRAARVLFARRACADRAALRTLAEGFTGRRRRRRDLASRARHAARSQPAAEAGAGLCAGQGRRSGDQGRSPTRRSRCWMSTPSAST